MDRLFKRSNFAKVNYLDKMWNFVIDPDNIGVEKEWFKNFPEKSRKMMGASGFPRLFSMYNFSFWDIK